MTTYLREPCKHCGAVLRQALDVCPDPDRRCVAPAEETDVEHMQGDFRYPSDAVYLMPKRDPESADLEGLSRVRVFDKDGNEVQDIPGTREERCDGPQREA